MKMLQLQITDTPTHQRGIETSEQIVLLASGTTYIGHGSLVPRPLRAICACAGLFFARVLAANEESYRLEIAALPHYFDADEHSRERHVRTITLSREQLTQLLEYDRRLAAMATFDVIEIMELHTREQQISRVCKSDVMIARSVAVPQEVVQTDAPAPVIMLSESDDIIIPTELLREIVTADEAMTVLKTTKSPHFTTMLLRAALRVLMQQQGRVCSSSRREALACQERELRRVLTYRHEIRPRVSLQMRDQDSDFVLRVAVPLQFAA